MNEDRLKEIETQLHATSANVDTTLRLTSEYYGQRLREFTARRNAGADHFSGR